MARFVFVVSCILLTANLVGCRARESKPSNGFALERLDRINYARLQSMVFELADEHVQTVGQAVDEIQLAGCTTDVRQRLERFKIGVASGAYIHATARNPEVALLDLVVQISLERSVIQRFGKATVGEVHVAGLLDAYERIYAEAWTTAARALSARQLEDLRKLIEEWIASHPTQQYVSYIRFNDFSMARNRSSLAGVDFGSVLASITPLSGIDAAAEQVEQTRMVWERTMFIAVRAPTLIRWQANSLLYTALDQPEMKQAMGNLHSFDATAKSLSGSLDRISTTLVDEEHRLKALVDESHKLVASANVTTAQLMETAKNIERATGNVQDIFTRLSSPTTMPTPTEADKYVDAMKSVSDAAAQLKATADGIQQIARDPELKQGLTAFNRATEARVDQGFGRSKELIDHLAWRALEVVLVSCVIVTLTVLILRRRQVR